MARRTRRGRRRGRRRHCADERSLPWLRPRYCHVGVINVGRGDGEPLAPRRLGVGRRVGDFIGCNLAGDPTSMRHGLVPLVEGVICKRPRRTHPCWGRGYLAAGSVVLRSSKMALRTCPASAGIERDSGRCCRGRGRSSARAGRFLESPLLGPTFRPRRASSAVCSHVPSGRVKPPGKVEPWPSMNIEPMGLSCPPSNTWPGLGAETTFAPPAGPRSSAPASAAPAGRPRTGMVASRNRISASRNRPSGPAFRRAKCATNGGRHAPAACPTAHDVRLPRPR